MRRLMRWLGLKGAEDAVRCGDDWGTLAMIEKLSVFRIGDYQVEAHSLFCGEARGRAALIGVEPYETSRETLGVDGYIIYEHSCLR